MSGPGKKRAHFEAVLGAKVYSLIPSVRAERDFSALGIGDMYQVMLKTVLVRLSRVSNYFNWVCKML